MFQSKEDKIFSEFEENPMILISVRGCRGYTGKQYYKSLKKLTKGVKKSPYNIKLWGHEIVEGILPQNTPINDKKWGEKVFIEYDALSGIPISYKMFKKLELDMNSRWIDFEALRVGRARSWYFDSATTGAELLITTLKCVWMEAEKKQGRVPHECESCGDSFSIDVETLECNNCEFHSPGIIKFPKKVSTMYPDITAYEEKRGITLLEKAS